MKKNVIESKVDQLLVSSRIEKKMADVTSWNPCGVVTKSFSDKHITVKWSENCGIITYSTLNNLMKVAKYYHKRYPRNVGYYVDTELHFNGTDFQHGVSFCVFVGMEEEQ